ncbi:MAG TPA: hypothetical protein VG675_04310 [Bryobacteraceae bacterium]|nr:hypothetical protein [Bryobacteraceae bacterium]
MTKRWVFFSMLLLALSLVAMAADISGKWVAQVPGRNGQTREQTFTFKVDGSTLTGSVSGRQGDTPISDGKIDGDNISFSVKREFNGQTMSQNYTGTISGDEIKMKREGRNGGQGQEFSAKRAQ